MSEVTGPAAGERPRRRHVIFVVKVSKLCNLRCRYCYEYSQLGDARRMSHGQLESMFRNIEAHYGQMDQEVQLRFVWHGGEPLVAPPAYYWKVFELQKEIFSSNISVKNSVQTNLTLLDPDRLELLRTGFTSVGVSVDHFGGLRVDKNEREHEDAIRDNMERLQAEGIDFGCITVLTRANIDHVEDIYRYNEERGIHFRVLPLFPGDRSDQHVGYEITAAETLEAYKRLVDMIFTREPIIWVDPVVGYIKSAVRYSSTNALPVYYDRETSERFFIVDTDGSAYSYADVYEEGYSYGNIFEVPMRDLMDSPGRRRSLREARQRLDEQCRSCDYFGACDGEPVADKLSEFPDMYTDGRRECIVERGTIRYILELMAEAGIVDPDGEMLPLLPDTEPL